MARRAYRRVGAHAKGAQMMRAGRPMRPSSKSIEPITCLPAVRRRVTKISMAVLAWHALRAARRKAESDVAAFALAAHAGGNQNRLRRRSRYRKKPRVMASAIYACRDRPENANARGGILRREKILARRAKINIVTRRHLASLGFGRPEADSDCESQGRSIYLGVSLKVNSITN